MSKLGQILDLVDEVVHDGRLSTSAALDIVRSILATVKLAHSVGHLNPEDIRAMVQGMIETFLLAQPPDALAETLKDE